MRTLLLTCLTLSTMASAALAQTAAPPDADAVQRELEAKAIRIPASDLAAALKASDDGRSDRARLVPRKPDWEAVRAELARTSADDETRDNETGIDQRRPPVRGNRPPPPPSGLRALAAERLPRTDRGETDIVLIPLLAPAHPDVRDNLKVYGQENTYTAVSKIDNEASLSISGVCNRVIGGAPNLVSLRKRMAEGPPRLTALRARYNISRNEFGVDLSFSKFGCGYVITIECGDTDNDERCTEDQYISRLADSMILINPERAGGE